MEIEEILIGKAHVEENTGEKVEARKKIFGS